MATTNILQIVPSQGSLRHWLTLSLVLLRYRTGFLFCRQQALNQQPPQRPSTAIFAGLKLLSYVENNLSTLATANYGHSAETALNLLLCLMRILAYKVNKLLPLD